jgi:hypothetical protein
VGGTIGEREALGLAGKRDTSTATGSEYCDRGRIEFFRGMRMPAGRVEMGRGSRCRETDPDVYGRPLTSNEGRGPSLILGLEA